MFSSILIANRGEIACRIIRTAKQLGYRTIAVYSQTDANALHVQQADQAVCIGPAPVNESYLKIDAIIQAARISGAQAIHPGYGFLSENAEFASACKKANLIFIGPSASAIELMGNKRQAKIAMKQAQVPCVPGYDETDQSNETLKKAAEKIGFPLMIKAAAGGGGRGMRLVEKSADFLAQLETARREALNAFGNDEVILEKAITGGRHIEIQIMADSFGNTLYLGERDCSSQRRHQKVIEEAPSPVVDEQLRQQLGEAAVRAAKACNYVGAGTIEFLLDDQNQFYFLEMNTRLQVEHPVTEMITGIDCVAWQFNIAQGEQLPLNQADIQLKGHAIEARLYAEDPNENFLPQTGEILFWQSAQGDWIRIDHGIAEKQTVSAYYDPMLAKVIAYGENREAALRHLSNALENTHLLGLRYNKDFLLKLLHHPVFTQGKMTTHFIGEHLPELLNSSIPSYIQLALAAYLLTDTQTASIKIHSTKLYALKIKQLASSSYEVDGLENPIIFQIHHQTDNCLYFSYQNVKQSICYIKKNEQVFFDNICLTKQNAKENQNEAAQDGVIKAPNDGLLVKLMVKTNQLVKKGDALLTLEAMKIQQTLTAPMDGKVLDIRVQEQHTVKRHQTLVSIG